MAKITTTLYGELAFLPYQAETPVRETLEFYTDLMQASDNSEERLQLRSKPRQSFEYTIPLQAWRSAASFNTEFGAIRKKWAVPIWTEAQYIGVVSAHAASIPCNTSLYDLRSNSLALLYSSADNWQIVEIGTAITGEVSVLNDLEYIKNVWLMPVRLGKISGNIDKPTNGHSGKSALTFEIDDNLELTPDTPTQYLNNDIYYEPGLLNGNSLSKSLQQKEQVIDFDLGPVERRTSWKNARYASPYSSVINGASEMRDYKNFLHRRAGKFRAFWLPSFESNLRVVNTGNIISTLRIEDDGFNDYEMRSHIAIQSTAGVWYPRIISNPVQLSGNRLQLTLSSALNIDAANVANVSFLGLHRFDADRIEINWIGNNVAQSEVTVLELSP